MKKQLIAIGVSLLVTFGAGAQWTGQSSSSDLVSPISRTGSVMTTNMLINDGVNGAQIRLNSSGTYYGKIGNPTPQVWSLGWGGSALDINPVLNWTAAGNIGVGTTTPSFKLDVGGNIVNTNTTNGWIGLTGDLPGYSNGVYGTLKTNATYIYFSGAGKYSGYLGGADAIFGLNNAASDLKVQLNTNGNSYFTGGNVGIGTMTPADQLEVVNGTRKVGLNTAISGITNGGVLSLSRADDGMKVMYLGTSAGPTDDPVLYGGGGGSEVRFVSGGLTGSGFGFYSNISSTNAFASTRPTPIVKIDGGGNVGIGNSSPDAKLAVSGQVHAQEVKVSVTVPGPDYVFEQGYRLPTLEEIKTYIGQNKHLPEVPSAAEMEKNGVKLGEMNVMLLKKVEELTLYQIQSVERIQRLEEEIAELKSKGHD